MIGANEATLPVIKNEPVWKRFSSGGELSQAVLLLRKRGRGYGGRF